MLLHHPHTDEQNHRLVDQSFKEQCCEIDSDYHCEMFYNRRVINKCDGYVTPAELEYQHQVQECLESSVVDELVLFGVSPCPCTTFQAELNSNFFQQQIGLPHQCYISSTPVNYNGFVFTLSLTQQCC